MPSNAGTGGDGAELVDDLSGDEVYVVVMETELRVAYAVTSELIEFSLFNPLTTLKGREEGREGERGRGRGGRERERGEGRGREGKGEGERGRERERGEEERIIEGRETEGGKEVKMIKKHSLTHISTHYKHHTHTHTHTHTQ